VLLQLLIDPACSIVFEADPEAGGLMERPPRPVSDSPFGAAPLGFAVLQGAGIAGLLLAGYAWLAAQGWSASQARSVVFGSLMLSVMLLILANRDLQRPALRGMTTANPWLWRMVLAMGGLLAVVLGLPWLRRLMGLELPGLAGVAAGAGLLTLCVIWLEGARLARRWLGSGRHGQPG